MLRICLAVLLLVLSRSGIAAPASAGLVLDLQGAGELVFKGERSRLKLLDYIPPGAQLSLVAGSKASVSHYAAKRIYRLSGPVQVEVESGAIRHLSGNVPQSGSISERTVTAALHPNLGPAAFKMRAVPQIVVLAPANGGSVLGTRPRFRWEANEATMFTLDLVELPDRSVAQDKVAASSWDLPANLELAHGKNYRWTVSYTSAVDGKMRSAAATFSLPSKADADMIAGLVPGPEADIDEWVLYATILKDWNMADAAASVWARIAERRPDLGHAR